MSHRRSAIRDRLRRRELVVASPVDEPAGDDADNGIGDIKSDLLRMDSGPLVQPASRHSSAFGRASSLSPPRYRSERQEDTGVVRLKAQTIYSPQASPGRQKLKEILGLGTSPRLNDSPVMPDATGDAASHQGMIDNDGHKPMKPSDELREWFRGVHRANWDDDESIPGLRVLDGRDRRGSLNESSILSRETSELGDLESVETGSTFSDRTEDIHQGHTLSRALLSPQHHHQQQPWTPRRQRMMASERSFHMREYDEGETKQWTGVTPNEFVCVSVGLMLLLLVTYLVQHGLRMGYLTPPSHSLPRAVDL